MSLSSAALSTIRRGYVVLVDLMPVLGAELGKNARPAVVVSPDFVNAKSPTLIVVPCLSEKDYRKPHPHEVALPAGEGGLEKDSIAVPNQIRTIDKERVTKVCGAITPAKLAQITHKVVWFVGGSTTP